MQALIGMGANNCKLIVVKPEKRDGYMADPLMTQSMKEAPKRGVPIEEITVPPRERPQSCEWSALQKLGRSDARRKRRLRSRVPFKATERKGGRRNGCAARAFWPYLNEPSKDNEQAHRKVRRHRDARRVALAQALRSLHVASSFARAWSLREQGITLLSVSAASRHHDARIHYDRGHMRVAPVTSLLICLVGAAASGQTDRAAPSALAASSPSTAVVLAYKRDKRTKHREWRMKRHLQAQRKGGSSKYTLPPNLGIGIGIGM